MKALGIHLDRERVLKFSNRAIRSIEGKFGGSLLTYFADTNATFQTDEKGNPILNELGLPVPVASREMMARMYSIETVGTLVWGGLLHEHAYTMDEVVDMIPLSRIMEIANTVITHVLEEYGTSETVSQNGVMEKQ